MKKPSRRPSGQAKNNTASSRSRNRPPQKADRSQKRSHPTPEEQIQSLIDLLKQNNLSELEWEHKDFRVRLRNEAATAPNLHLPPPQIIHEPVPVENTGTAQTSQITDTTGMVTITSPIVGTFYRSPSPDADPYVEENETVKKGQVLCIVEAMKLMNEIESEVDGRVVKILVDSTKPVEYGQALFLIDPAPST